jgi:flagellar biosynthesis protein FlhF
MRLKLYREADVATAMARIRADLGPEALILSTRRIQGGVELTAALEVPDATPATPSADLAYHGVPDGLATRLGGADLAASLAAALRFGPLPIGPGAPPLLLAGLPGAGKTLSVARLATRLVLAGLRPVVITADGRRAGAAEELAAYTRLLGLELMVACTPRALARALAAPSCDGGQAVLIDTAGINPFAPGECAALVELAGQAGASPVLVMAAGQHAGEAAEQAQAFAPLGARHLLPTRLDIVRRLGSVLAAADTGDLALTEWPAGPGATEPATDITPAFLAARLARPAPAPPQAPRHRAPPTRRPPVFPKARTHAAESWSTPRHG